MRKTTLRSLLIAFVSICLLASCSEVRDVTTSANYKLRLHKADGNAPATAQAFVSKKMKQLPAKDQVLTAIQSDNNSAPQLREVNPQIQNFVGKQSNSTDNTKVTNKSLQRINKAMERVNQKQAQAEVKPDTKDATPAKPAGSSGKSQLVALLLCILLGGLGIHRFYLGYIWQGVVQLLTGGGCGIWALIDLIRIILGTLQPKDGHYSSTL
ncbi:MAG TPA: TM2 domain-containing protein [Chitinophagales bacterium]|nr:TM2 domain-containing protein [Chitinophagales bacterium]